jgi:vancomycin resistance protein YoaR
MAAKKSQLKAEKEVPAEKKQRFLLSKKVRNGIGIVVGLAVLAGGSYAWWQWSDNHVVGGISLYGKKVAWDTQPELQAHSEQVVTELRNTSLQFTFEDETTEKSLADLEIEVSVNDLVNRAWAVGHEGTFLTKLKERLMMSKRTITLDTLEASSDSLIKLGEHLENTQKPAKEPTVELNAGARIVPGESGVTIELVSFTTGVLAAFSNKTTGPIAVTTSAAQPTIAEDDLRPLADEVRERYKNDLKISTTAGPLEVKVQQLADITKLDPDTRDGKKTLALRTNNEALERLAASVARSVFREARDASLAITNGIVSINGTETDGFKLKEDVFMERIRGFIENGDAVKSDDLIEVTKPKIRGGDGISQLGLVQKIGTATTDFVGSPSNRVENIKNGSRLVSGFLVAPGETVGTIGRMGPITTDNGYVLGKVIKGNETTDELGGGLCQVSTTLFRAVMNAGLPIVARRNHSYRVSYYEKDWGPGTDATVYDPNPDFKWKNDTGNHVFVVSYVKGTKITYDLYGTSDGRVGSISKPTVTNVTQPAEPQYVDDPTLDAGVTKQLEVARPGAQTSVTYTVRRNGEVINSQVFKSSYKAWQAKYLRGTKGAQPSPTPSSEPAPTSTPEPTPTPGA